METPLNAAPSAVDRERADRPNRGRLATLGMGWEGGGASPMQLDRPVSGRRHAGERGVVLVWVTLTMIVVGGLIAASVQSELALEASGSHEAAAPAHARDVAQAGLVDALAWFRRQSDQPVTLFAPRRVGTPPDPNETDDPTVGLVRTYEVTPSLMARYEVRLTRPAEPFVDLDGDARFTIGETYSDVNGNGKYDEASGARDVSLLRGHGTAGSTWLLESQGSLFRAVESGPLGEGRNVRLANTGLGIEIRRMAIRPPAAAAICAASGSSVALGNRARVRGSSGAAVAYAPATGSPLLQTGSEVFGVPPTTAVPDYDASLESVFGLDLAGLKAAADAAFDGSVDVPSPMPEQALVVIDGDVVFDSSTPLHGLAVVVVTGNVTIQSGSNSFFNGLLWVGGNLIVRAPCLLSGTLIVQGSVDVRGLGGDFAEIQQDDELLQRLLQTMGQYRFSKAVFRLASPDGSSSGGGSE